MLTKIVSKSNFVLHEAGITLLTIGLEVPNVVSVAKSVNSKFSISLISV
jgi:hypothetical protein